MRIIAKLMDIIISAVSFEWLLNHYPNGGSVIFIRSFFISTAIFLASIGFLSSLEPTSVWEFDLTVLKRRVREIFPWFGAIFAATYAALYSRFASQWAYLASLYNAIMAAAVQSPPKGRTSEEVLRIWQAAFIEDAKELHLAGKPMFASLINQMLDNPDIRRHVEDHHWDGDRGVAVLRAIIEPGLRR